MKKYLLILSLLLLVAQAHAQGTTYFEGFNNNQNNWTNKEASEYNAYIYDGYYYLTHKRTSGSWVFWNAAEFNEYEDFVLETQIAKVYGPADSYYGIEFGRKNNSSKYSFYIRANGTYLLGFPDGSSTGWRRTNKINAYSDNHFKVVKTAYRLRYYLNGEFLDEQAFQPFEGKLVAFSLSLASKVKVDYLKVSANTYSNQTLTVSTGNNNLSDLSFGFYNLEKLIRDRVEKEFALWAVKDEFEKSEQYRERIENKDLAVRRMTEEAVNFYKKEYLAKVNFSDFEVHTYDADAETFKITLDKLGDFYLHVPLVDARTFKENADRIRFSNVDLKIKDNNWVLSYLDVYDPTSGKTFSYDITKEPDYNPVKYTPVINGLRVDLPEIRDEHLPQERGSGATVEHTLVLGDPLVDVKIPENDKVKQNTFAIIIGNEDYTKYNPKLNADSNVKFARRDAEIFKEYAEKTLGIPEGNIVFMTDAISTQINREINRVVTMAKVRQGEVLFYYAGHGFPDAQTKDAYIMPVDVTAGEMHSRGIALSDLYAQLSDKELKRATVFLDACFSGGGRNVGLTGNSRFAKIKPNRQRLSGNLVVFSASSGTQVSKSYDEMKHGMFTYFLLKKLHETKGEVSYGELYEYLDKEVTFMSVKKYYEQTPEVNVSLELQDSWRDWKF
jgi:hypothetical protein